MTGHGSGNHYAVYRPGLGFWRKVKTGQYLRAVHGRWVHDVSLATFYKTEAAARNSARAKDCCKVVKVHVTAEVLSDVL